MSGGTISNVTVDWIAGAVGFIVLLSVVLAFIIQIRSIKSKADCDKQAAIDKAVAEAKKETESALEFRLLKDSVNKTGDTVKELAIGINTKMEDFKSVIDKHSADIIELKASAKSFHKRMDEHRLVDHEHVPITENGGK